MRKGRASAACLGFATLLVAAAHAQACEIIVSAPPPRGSPPPPAPAPLPPQPLPAGSTMVLGQVSDAIAYRIDGSLDDQARVWDVRMTLAALDVGALPQPETVLWHTGSCGVSLPQPVVGRTYRLVLTQVRDGRWVVEDVVTPEVFEAYRAGLRAR